MMVLYLTSKVHMNILDFLREKEELIIQKYVGEFDLKDVLSKSIHRLGHVEAIVIDRSSLTGTEEEIIDAVRTYKSLSKMKIIFYIADDEQRLVHELIGLGVFNIITESEVERLREEIKMCILEEMPEKYIKDKFGLACEEREGIVFDFKGKQITIGLIGSQHRVGTTTVAIQFACYLNSIGAIVSYVEANNSGHMKIIAEHYKMEKTRDGYLYSGIAFEGLNSANDVAFDFIVYDFGTLNNRTKIGLLNCNIKILNAGKRPQELYFYNEAMKILDNKHKMDNIITMTAINNSEKEYRLNLGRTMLNYHDNQQIFEAILNGYFL